MACLLLPQLEAWRCVFVSDEIYEALDCRFLRGIFFSYFYVIFVARLLRHSRYFSVVPAC